MMQQVVIKPASLPRCGESQGVEWGLADVAAPRDVGGISLQEYMWAEDLLLLLFERLVHYSGRDSVVIAEPTLGMALPPWLPEFRNGSIVGIGQAAALLRCMLRSCPIGCTLQIPHSDLRIQVGFEFQLTVESSDGPLELLRRLMPEGLTIALEQESPQVELETRVADSNFWRDVIDDVFHDANRALVVERWAYGNWGETWYAPALEDIPAIRRLLKRNSLVMVERMPQFETGVLGRCFDQTNIVALDNQGLRCFRWPTSGLKIDLQVLSSEAFSRLPWLWTEEVAICPSVFAREHPVNVAIMPDLEGTVTARWLG